MKRILLYTVALVFGLAAFAQESIYFPGFETINVHDKYQFVTSKLLQNYVEDNGKYTILLSDKLNNDVGYSESPEETRKNALLHKASYYLIGDMSAIGNLLIVNVKMYNTASSELVWSDALKADELEDLDPVMKLLAKAIGTEEAAVDAGDIYSVTEYDSNELNKRQATESWGITIGGGSLLSSDAGSKGVSGFGVLKSYDGREFILDVKGEMYFGDEWNARRIGINLLRPINRNNQALFYGAGFFYGGMTIEEENRYISNGNTVVDIDTYSDSGLELEANFGIILNRLSTIQVRAMISPMIAFYEVGGNTAGALRFGIIANF